MICPIRGMATYGHFDNQRIQSGECAKSECVFYTIDGCLFQLALTEYIASKRKVENDGDIDYYNAFL